MSRAYPVSAPRSDQALDLLVRVFKGLANPGRLRIVAALLDKEKSVGEIVAETGLAQAQVSNALACLRWCGFVRPRPDGRRVYYGIASDTVRDMLRLAERMVADHAADLYSCAVLAAEEGREGDDREPL